MGQQYDTMAKNFDLDRWGLGTEIVNTKRHYSNDGLTASQKMMIGNYALEGLGSRVNTVDTTWYYNAKVTMGTQTDNVV